MIGRTLYNFIGTTSIGTSFFNALSVLVGYFTDENGDYFVDENGDRFTD